MQEGIFDFQGLMLSQIIEEDAEFIPLLTTEEDEDVIDASIPEELAILTLRNTVLFPGVVIPITVGRDMSIKLVNDAYKNGKTIAVVGVIVLAIVTYFFSYLVGLGYFIGAFLSGVAGYVGMLISVKANVRTAEASRKSFNLA